VADAAAQWIIVATPAARPRGRAYRAPTWRLGDLAKDLALGSTS